MFTGKNLFYSITNYLKIQYLYLTTGRLSPKKTHFHHVYKSAKTQQINPKYLWKGFLVCLSKAVIFISIYININRSIYNIK